MRPGNVLKSARVNHAGAIGTILVSAVALTLPSECAHSVQLLRNGSFEEDGFTTGALLTGWSDGAAQGNDLGFRVGDYPFGDCGGVWCSGSGGFVTPGPPSGGVSGPIGHGGLFASQFGVGNGIGLFGSATQHVDLTGRSGMQYTFSAWLSSLTGDTDYAIVSLRFFTGSDASGNLLSEAVFDGNDQQSPFIVGSADEQGKADPIVPATQDNWTLYRAEGIIPPVVNSAAVVLRTATVTGVNGDHGFVDLVSLEIVPEPATSMLAFALLPLAYGLTRCRKRNAAESNMS